MARVINCECGQVIRGDSDEELVSKAAEHVNRSTRNWWASSPSRTLLGMAEEE